VRYLKEPEWLEPSETGMTFRLPRPVYPPGRHYRYSNYNFLILGALLKKVSGRELGEYIENEVFLPAGMNRAKTSYTLTGAGGVLTTLPDLAAYATMLLNKGGAVLQASTLERMLEKQIYIPLSGSTKYVGLGWRVHADSDGVLTFFHIGGDNGVAAWVQMFPRYNAAVVYLANPPAYDDRLMGNLLLLQKRLGDLATAMTGAPSPLYLHKSSFFSASQIPGFTGTYQNPLDKKIIQIQLKDDKLHVQTPYEFNTDLEPETSNVFVGTNNNLNYDFTFSKKSNRILGLSTWYGYFQRLNEDGTPVSVDDVP
jgi:hypothetical protein